MEFGENIAHFNLFDDVKQPIKDYSICKLEIMDYLIQEAFPIMISKNPTKIEERVSKLEFDIPKLLFPPHSSCHAPKIPKNLETLDSIEILHPPSTCLEASIKMLPSTIQPSKLEVKPLLNHLKYALLIAKEQLLIIIAKNLPPK